MKVRSPRTRYNLKIKPGSRILDISGTHTPHPQANVVADVLGDIVSGQWELWNHQHLVHASCDKLPFEDKEFDYVICAQVMEHVDNPEALMREMQRVAKKGYIELPSMITEFMIPDLTHHWLSLELDHKIYIVSKKQLGIENPPRNYGAFFAQWLNKESLSFKTFVRANPDVFSVRYEWEDEIEFCVNPTDERILTYFTEPWNTSMYQTLFERRSTWAEIKATHFAFMEVLGEFIQGRRKSPSEQPNLVTRMKRKVQNAF